MVIQAFMGSAVVANSNHKTHKALLEAQVFQSHTFHLTTLKLALSQQLTHVKEGSELILQMFQREMNDIWLCLMLTFDLSQAHNFTFCWWQMQKKKKSMTGKPILKFLHNLFQQDVKGSFQQSNQLTSSLRHQTEPHTRKILMVCQNRLQQNKAWLCYVVNTIAGVSIAVFLLTSDIFKISTKLLSILLCN